MDVDNFYNLDVNKTIEFIKKETIYKKRFSFNKKTGKKYLQLSLFMFGKCC